jgi:predicted MFS family arabinose efflux permease
MNATIKLLSAMSFLVVAVMNVTGPLLPVIARDFAILVGEAGIVVTAFAIPYGLAQLFCGPIADRIGKLRVIAGSLTLSLVFVVGSGFSQTLTQLVTMRFLSGLAMAGTIPLAMAYIADEVPYEARQLVIGKYINGIIWGSIAGAFFGGIAVEYFEWRQVFFFLGFWCCLLCIVLWLHVQKETLSSEPLDIDTVIRLYGSLFREAASRTAMIAVTLEGFFVFGPMAYFGAYLRQVHHLDYSLIGLTLSAYGVGGLCYVASVNWLVPKLGERGLVTTGGVVMCIALFVLAYASSWWIASVAFFFAGFGFYLIHNTMQTRATELSVHARGAAMSLWAFMLFVGQGVGVFVFGTLVDDYGYSMMFVVASLGMLSLGLWFQGRIKTLQS